MPRCRAHSAPLRSQLKIGDRNRIGPSCSRSKPDAPEFWGNPKETAKLNSGGLRGTMNNNPPSGEASSEREIRAAFRRMAGKITALFLDPRSDRFMEAIIRQLIGFLNWLRRERRRKARSKDFRELEKFLSHFAEGTLGPLATFSAAQISDLEGMLDAMITAIVRPGSDDKIDPIRFVALQKKILVHPKKRGPKEHSVYDEAYRLWKLGEPITDIAQRFAPGAYQADNLNTLQKFSKAIHRREKRVRRVRTTK